MAKKSRTKGSGSRVRHVSKKASASRSVKSRGPHWSDRLGGSILPLGISVVLVAGIVLFLVLTYSTITESSFFKLDTVAVNGVGRASQRDIEKIVASNAERTGVWNADLLAIKEKVEKLTFVKNAAITRSLPNGISVTVKERTPVAIVRTPRGDQLVDAEGMVLSAAGKTEPGLPFVMLGWDEAKSERSDRENIERLKAYQKMLVEWTEFDLAARVKAVDISDVREPKATLEDSGLPVTITLGRDNYGKQLADGIRAIVGKGKNFEGVNLVGPNLVLVERKQN